mgnify:FL=1
MPKHAKEKIILKLILLSLAGLIFVQSSKAAVSTQTSYQMKVLVLKFFPLTSDGQNIDIWVTGDVGDSYSVIRQKTVDITNNLLSKISTASKYRGYTFTNAIPSLTYQIVDTREYTQAVPIKPRINRPRYPDYYQVLQNNNICSYVSAGVSEVWLWAYHGPLPSLDIDETKMSSPFGDISNSFRYDDLPHCGRTYRVYTFNYGRGTGEAFHTWGHQIEAELTAVDSYLFRTLFQGTNYPQTVGTLGRCGSVHNPPNARFEYDWSNQTAWNSDCLAWNPWPPGIISAVSCSLWGCSFVNDTNNPQLNYLVWYWQNLPGRGNPVLYNGKPLRNFWDIHGDFDRVLQTERKLTLIDLKELLNNYLGPGSYLDYRIDSKVNLIDAAEIMKQM